MPGWAQDHRALSKIMEEQSKMDHRKIFGDNRKSVVHLEEIFPLSNHHSYKK